MAGVLLLLLLYGLAWLEQLIGLMQTGCCLLRLPDPCMRWNTNKLWNKNLPTHFECAFPPRVCAVKGPVILAFTANRRGLHLSKCAYAMCSRMISLGL